MAMTNLVKILCTALTVAALSCATPPERTTLSEEERMAEEHRLGERWAQGIELLLERRSDRVIEDKIRSLAVDLGSIVRPQVTLFYARLDEDVSPIFVLPGDRWYLSVTALKLLRYDNELAAAVAGTAALSRVHSGWTSESGVTDTLTIPEYADSEWREVNLRMVDLLYQSGFDPRGVPQFWKKVTPVWKGRSPDWGAALQEEGYSQISRRVPLLNPVVRTSEFTEIEKRLKLL